MSLVKFISKSNVVPFSQTMSRVFDDFFRVGAGYELAALNIKPSVDIIEEDHRILLKADMPGLDKSHIKVIVHDGMLAIEGQRDETREENKRGIQRTERFMGTFSRSFTLPTWADDSKVEADYKDGVLTVTIPKTEQARSKEIEIKVA